MEIRVCEGGLGSADTVEGSRRGVGCARRGEQSWWTGPPRLGRLPSTLGGETASLPAPSRCPGRECGGAAMAASSGAFWDLCAVSSALIENARGSGASGARGNCH